MIFASYPFVLAFLPAVVLVVVAIGYLRPADRTFVAWALILASLIFYGWWDWRYLFLIAGSTAANFILGTWISQRGRSLASSYAFAFGIIGNLAVLGYFKYANFLVANTQAWWGMPAEWAAVVLPLGISFFTFQKIAFLVDCHRGEVTSYRFRDFLLFVLFFPQLIAGPITHHREFVDQLDQPGRLRVTYESFAIGLVIFSIGLFKKTVLADTFAMFANAMFDNLADGNSIRQITFVEAWGGVLAYSFQIYFDFSGYSDMAIGMAAMFGIRLPLNFDGPYRATSIIDFWRRWHVTLSRFLRDYVYIALGGNRRGNVRLCVNLLITMVLGGIWHGANWTFLVWGAVHGCLLAINHAWRRLAWPVPGPLGWVLTMLCVATAWAYFRADSLQAANAVVSAMWGFNGLSLPFGARSYLSAIAPMLESGGIRFDGAAPGFTAAYCAAWIGLGLAIVLFLPTTHEWLKKQSPALPNQLAPEPPVSTPIDLPFRLSFLTALVLALALGLSLLRMAQPGTFIYWQF